MRIFIEKNKTNMCAKLLKRIPNSLCAKCASHGGIEGDFIVCDYSSAAEIAHFNKINDELAAASEPEPEPSPWVPKPDDATVSRSIHHLKKDHQYVKCPRRVWRGAAPLDECVQRCVYFRGLTFDAVQCSLILETKDEVMEVEYEQTTGPAEEA